MVIHSLVSLPVVVITCALLVGCSQEAAHNQTPDESTDPSPGQRVVYPHLQGYWFQPQAALRNIAFWPDGEFVFNEWERSELPKRGTFKLQGNRLTLTFANSDTISLVFEKGRNDDPNWYITGDETMVRGGDLLSPDDEPVKDSPIPRRLADFLTEKIPGSRLLPANLWLDPQYLAEYNANDLISDKIAYPDNVFVRGDFNGDRLTDFAGFFINDSGEVELLAFHSRHDIGLTFLRYNVESLQKVKQCCVGIGLTVRPPGRYAQPFVATESSKNIATDSLLLTYYEKATKTFFFEGSGYGSFFSSD